MSISLASAPSGGARSGRVSGKRSTSRRIIAERCPAQDLSLREAGLRARLSLASLDESSRCPKLLPNLVVQNSVVDCPFRACGPRAALRRQPPGGVEALLSRRWWRFRLRRWRAFVEHGGIGCEGQKRRRCVERQRSEARPSVEAAKGGGRPPHGD